MMNDHAEWVDACNRKYTSFCQSFETLFGFDALFLSDSRL
jgi:hypothetical protein